MSSFKLAFHFVKIAGLTVAATALWQPVSAQTKPQPELTALEEMSSQRGTKTVLATVVDEIESTGSRATVSAVVFENPYYQPDRQRGVRVDFKSESATEQVYIEESELVHLKYELERMDCSVPGAASKGDTPNRAYGIARCRPSQTSPQAYCPGYIVSPDFEGFSVSTFSGGSFRFPQVRPSVFVAAIGKAMNELGIDDAVPTMDDMPVPPADIEQIVESSVRHFPELASSPGIKVASYMSRDDKHSVWAIFLPHENIGDVARARTVYCTSTPDVGSAWECDRSKPRVYLNLESQSRQLVVTGEIDRDTALSLVELTQRALLREQTGTAEEDWLVSMISPPKISGETFRVIWTDGDHRSAMYEVKPLMAQGEDQYEIVRAMISDGDRCG